MDLQRKIDQIQRELERRSECGRLLQNLERRIDERPGVLVAAHADGAQSLRGLLADPLSGAAASAETSPPPAVASGDWEERAREAHRRWQAEAARARRAEQDLERLRELEAKTEQLAAERAVLLHELAWFCLRCERGEVDLRRAHQRFREVLEELAAGGRPQNSGGA